MTKRVKYSIVASVIVVVCVLLDQILKLWVANNMALGECRPVCGDWFFLYYIQNKGMAFGMSFGDNIGKLLLSLFRVAVVGVIIYVICKKIKENKIDMLALCVLSLIVAGAIGNIIDSAFYGLALGIGDPHFMYGSVVDMIYVKLFRIPDWFPGFGGNYFFPAIFNFADACVTVGIIVMLCFNKHFFSDDKTPEKTKQELSDEKTPAQE